MFKRTTAINKILGLTKRKKVVQGGTSASKTYGILAVLINKALSIPQLDISVVSESIPHLRRGAIRDFLKILEMTQRFDAQCWNRSLLTYAFPNGSTIEFFSADQEAKLRGARRNILYINEANNVDFQSYHQLAIRTSKEIFLDFNPTQEFWAHTEVLQEPDSELLVLTYLDNEALPENVLGEINNAIEKAKTSSYWENWVNVYVHGQIGSLQGVVFDNWEEIAELPKEARYIGMGLDFGYTNDPSACTALYEWNDKIILDEVLYSSGLLNSDIAREVIKYNDGFQEITADCAEPKSIDELSGLGLDIMPSEKGADSIRFGISIMQEHSFLITKRSTNIIQEFRSYAWATDKTGKQTGKPEDRNNHAIDGIRYKMVDKFNGKYGGNYSVSRI